MSDSLPPFTDNDNRNADSCHDRKDGAYHRSNERVLAIGYAFLGSRLTLLVGAHPSPLAAHNELARTAVRALIALLPMNVAFLLTASGLEHEIVAFGLLEFFYNRLGNFRQFCIAVPSILIVVHI